MYHVLTLVLAKYQINYIEYAVAERGINFGSKSWRFFVLLWRFFVLLWRFFKTFRRFLHRGKISRSASALS